MAITVGTIDCAAGATQRAYNAFNAVDPAVSLVLPLPADGAAGHRTAAQDAALRSILYACVKGVLDEVLANAQARTIIGAGVGALQRTPNPNNPDTDTAGPSMDRTLLGTIL